MELKLSETFVMKMTSGFGHSHSHGLLHLNGNNIAKLIKHFSQFLKGRAEHHGAKVACNFLSIKGKEGA